MKKTVFDADVLGKTSSLKIQARNLVEGFLSGQHKSRHKGSSVEFAEYKDYSPGDETRHIDWKAVGKTDKYQVKQFEQSTNLKCTLLLDASGSMSYRSPLIKSPSISKMEYARTLTATLSYLILRQFDAVGLILFNERVTDKIPPRSKPSHFQHIVNGLENFTPKGITRISDVIGEITERLPGRSMVILISDLLTREDNLNKSLKLLCSRGLEVIVFHILHPDELNLPFEGDIEFESLEDDLSVKIDPADIREAYRTEILNMVEGHKKNLLSLGVDYIFMETSTPLEQSLNYYLLRRKSLYKI